MAMQSQQQRFDGEPERVELANAGITDVATSQDTLGFKPYVDALAQFLMHENTQGPLTLSIEGEWGMGKSSFMQQLKEALREDALRDNRPKVGVVEFNAWRHENQEALWAAFAHRVVTSLHAQSSFRERLASRMRLMRSRVDWWRNGLRAVALVAALALMLVVVVRLASVVMHDGIGSIFDFADADKTLTAVLGATGLAGSILGTIIIARKIFADVDFSFAAQLRRIVETPDYASHSAFIEEFHDDFQKIVDAYLTDRKGVIFIDDLDRCAVPKAADLMQAISLMISESPKLIFVLGLDREKVAAGLAIKYEKIIPFIAASRGVADAKSVDAGLEFGYSFLEKFIQLPFRVPRATPDQIRRLVTSLAGTGDHVPEEEPATRPDIVEIVEGSDAQRVCEIVLMVAPVFDNNPRRIKQFLNAFRLQTHIASSTGLFAQPDDPALGMPLTLERLAKFVALTLRWPALHDDIRATPTLLDELQESVIASLSGPVGTAPAPGSEAAEWLARRALRELLARGLTDEYGNIDYIGLDRHSLVGLDTATLLAISAPVDRKRREAHDGDGAPLSDTPFAPQIPVPQSARKEASSAGSRYEGPS
jgi:hypothetical protein